MDKKQKLTNGFTIGSLLFAIVAIFMGFADGLVSKEGGDGLKLFDYTFNKGEMAYFKEVGNTHNAGLIIAFVLLLLAIIAIATLVVLNLMKKSNAKINLAIGIGTIVALVAAAILVFCTKQYFLKIFAEDPEEQEAMKQMLKLGAGAICTGVFGLVAAGGLTTALVLNKKAA